MNEEEILRKEAVRLHLQGVSVKDISAQLNRSRQWVHKWLKQYERKVHPNPGTRVATEGPSK
jgi:transposase-like protein